MPLGATASALLTCLVIGVSDGDTLTARCESARGHENMKIRIAEIDAPEKAQAFGNRSKQHLAAMCFAKAATVKSGKRDRYGRTVAHVSCDGVDVSAEQVRAGMAWVYDRYVTDRSLYAIQTKARASRTGLWEDLRPTPPWEWRKRSSDVNRGREPGEASGWVDFGDVGDTARREQSAR